MSIERTFFIIQKGGIRMKVKIMKSGYIKETAGERKGKVKLFDLGGEKYIVNIMDGRIIKHKEMTDLIIRILMNYAE